MNIFRKFNFKEVNDYIKILPNPTTQNMIYVNIINNNDRKYIYRMSVSMNSCVNTEYEGEQVQKQGTIGERTGINA